MRGGREGRVEREGGGEECRREGGERGRRGRVQEGGCGNRE